MNQLPVFIGIYSQTYTDSDDEESSSEQVYDVDDETEIQENQSSNKPKKAMQSPTKSSATT